MSQCQTSPTATEFATITTNSESTSVSTEVSTSPASVTTIESTICTTATLSGSVVTSSCSTTEITSTIAEGLCVSPNRNQSGLGGGDSPSDPNLRHRHTIHDRMLQYTNQRRIHVLINDPNIDSNVDPHINPHGFLYFSLFLHKCRILYFSLALYVTHTSTSISTSTAVVPGNPDSNDGSSHTSHTNVGAIVGGVVGGVGGAIVLLLLVWYIIHRRHKNRDDDFDDDYAPIPIKLRKTHEKRGKPGALSALDDDLTPTPFDPYGYGAVAAGETAGAGASTAAPPPTSTVRRRTVTSGDSSPTPGVGSAGSTPPLVPSPGHSQYQNAYPGQAQYQNQNPYSNQADYQGQTQNPYQHQQHEPRNLPWADDTPGAGPSAAAALATSSYLPNPYPPTESGSSNAGTSSNEHGGPRRLQVANPNPDANASASSASAFAVGDVKDPLLYLTAEHGMERRPGVGGSGVAQGSPSAPFVHRDAGAIPTGSQPSTPGQRPVATAATDRAQGLGDALETQEVMEPPPPAYEA
ncbi:hypothetical protein EIP86_007495 [Pleurotus ostreatoroseus]|nr:hypothetical protein EIP86_007495 [Pleurotus ostreatoroseus]